ncbi:hypothetical protein PAXINDRAFT_13478 [Paxillus involutus ATCC 200175]|uniref:Unplaced genomic scaffold PAXINscaffold_27, whole genome shotgun sequence n=1 Tax=Paxillus involutus ATCC 200175 TaxID=664439 RepID=A0A0C9U2B5_PAXIN|nr:hypothetical protein PAXINDRAFT_13478 [Paxillus involutus ATCC 200175]
MEIYWEVIADKIHPMRSHRNPESIAPLGTRSESYRTIVPLSRTCPITPELSGAFLFLSYIT